MKSVTSSPIAGDSISLMQTLRDHAEAINQAAAGNLAPFVSTTGTYTSRTSDQVVYVAPSAPCTITLPAPSLTVNMVLRVKRSNNTTHTITVAGASGNIDGSASTTLTTAYQAKAFHSDGANYWTV